MVDMPLIDREKCGGCGLCVSVCHCKILEIVDDKVTVMPREGCQGCRTWCTLCEDICPERAISCAFEVIIENKPESK